MPQPCRRVAFGTLAEMGNYKLYVTSMHECGLFQHVPGMLKDLVPRYRWGQKYRQMYGCGRGTD